MAIDLRGHTVPSGTDNPKRSDLNALSLSINATKTVANMTEAAQYITALQAVSLPTNGAVIFNTDDKKYYGRIDNAWAEIKTTANDTGWVTSGLTVTGNTNFQVTGYSLRRRDNLVMGRILVTFKGNNLSSNAQGDFPNVAMGAIPGAWAPTGYSTPLTLELIGGAVSYGWANSDGTLTLTASSLQSQVVLTKDTNYAIYLNHWVG